MRDSGDVEPQAHRHPLRPAATSARPSCASRCTSAASPSGSAGTAISAGSSARASVSRAPALAPRSAAALVTAWTTGPCVPSTVRTTGASGAQSALFAQRSIASCGNQMESTRFMREVHRPGGIPRARNSSASHAGAPGACGSRSLASDGALAIRQRMRAPLRLAWPPSRIKKAATPDRSEATASRRVAVKSSARGSPQISPITAESARAS